MSRRAGDHMRRAGLIAAWLLASIVMLACTPPPAPTEPSFSGVWTGPLPVSATETRTFAVQLHERHELKLLGYMLGGTSRRTLVGGARFGDDLLLIFEMNDPALSRTIMLRGTISGDTLTGTAFVNSETFPVTWTRRTDQLVERRFVFATSTEGDDFAELAIVQDASGALVTGSFTADTCDFVACGGGVTAFAETSNGDLNIGVESDGDCRGVGTLTATFNPSNAFYSGSWAHTSAAGCGSSATTGALVGARDMGTRSNHVASLLSNLGTLADDLENGADFAAPYAPVSDSYLHFGEDTAAFLAARNGEVAAHPNAQVNFSDISTVRTLVPPGMASFFSATPRVSFSDTRVDASGTYRSVDAGTPAQGGLSYISEEAGAWRISGNQVGEFDLPFAYTIGAERLLAPTGAADQNLSVSLGGWGAHFSPQTGHPIGNAKADLIAQYVGSGAELTELANGAGGIPGSCDVALVWANAGEVCGVYGGLSGELIRARILTYRAPYTGRVTEILYEERPRPAAAPQTHYFDNVPHWSVQVEFSGGLTIRFAHLGQLVGPVRAGLIATTGIDPDTYSPSSVLGAPNYCPPSPGRCRVNVLNGASFNIAAHDPIARAQTDAAPIPGHPGYYRGQVGPSIPPWSQVEFFVSENVGARSADVCVYQYLPTARQSAFAALMTGDMLNHQSLRYGAPSARPWQFRAEASLCNNDGYMFRSETDFSSIHAQLGGWYERDSPGAPASEVFAIARIHPDASAYSPTLYDHVLGGTAPTGHLIARLRNDGGAFNWTVPGVGSVMEHYPAGEALELTETSFVVKWRDIGPADLTLYQRAVYEIDNLGLKIKWGALSTTLDGAPVPVLAPAEACNDTTTICYNHHRP